MTQDQLYSESTIECVNAFGFFEQMEVQLVLQPCGWAREWGSRWTSGVDDREEEAFEVCVVDI